MKDNGGPAFPQVGLFNPREEFVTAADYRADQEGMTLRDWFAGRASEDDVAHWFRKLGSHSTREAAKYAYADAMLKARKEEA